MAQLFTIHPQNPQARLVNQAVECLRSGGVIVYPTDSCYAFGWSLDAKGAGDRVRRTRQLDGKHLFTLVCRDLSELASHARVDNARFRLLKALTPGPYTFILQATREVPRRLQHPRRNTIGLRVPDNPVVHAVLDLLGEPLLSSTVALPGDDLPLTDAEEIHQRLGSQVDMVLDGGSCGHQATTVVDLTEDPPRVLRQGLGDASLFDG